VRAESLRLLIPLYIYPAGNAWQSVAQANRQVPITAIINPQNGPGGLPNADYQRGMKQLRQAGVKMLGYVSTNYGQRSITAVQQDIDLYARHFPVSGIFLDESSSQPAQLKYYTQIYRYIRQRSQLRQVVINPGVNVDEGYFQNGGADTVVTFENNASQWSQYQIPGYAKKYQSDRFAMLIHTAPSTTAMKQHLRLAKQRGVKYVFVTDRDLASNPWGALPKFWQQQVNYLQQLNQN
jgi:hypothetical protein